MSRPWGIANKVSTLITISQFVVPTMSAIVIAAITAGTVWFNHLGTIPTLIIFLIVVVTVLWFIIGAVWLFDRSKLKNPYKAKKALDCSWGLVVDSAFITFNQGGSACQVAVSIRNTLTWPLRAEVTHRHIVIEGKLPDQPLDPEFSKTFILMPGIPLGVNFAGYGPNNLPDVVLIKGEIELKIKYGHPDVGFSRIMGRYFRFEQQIKFSLPLGMLPLNGGVPMGRVPLAGMGPFKEDEDFPLSGKF